MVFPVRRNRYSFRVKVRIIYTFYLLKFFSSILRSLSKKRRFYQKVFKTAHQINKMTKQNINNKVNAITNYWITVINTCTSNRNLQKFAFSNQRQYIGKVKLTSQLKTELRNLVPNTSEPKHYLISLTVMFTYRRMHRTELNRHWSKTYRRYHRI